MIFTLKSDVLKDSTKYLAGALGTASIVYKSILIEAGEDYVDFYTNNGLIGYRYRVMGDSIISIEQSGTSVVDAFSFLKFVSMVNSDTLLFTHVEANATIKAGRRELKLVTLSADDFIAHPEATTEFANVDADEFKQVLKSAVPLTSDTPEVISGVCVDPTGIVCATNRAVLITIPFANTLENKIVLRKEMCSEIARFTVEGNMKIKKDSNTISVNVEGVNESITLSSQELYDEYPNVSGLLDKLKLPRHIALPFNTFYNEMLYVDGIHNDALQVIELEQNDNTLCIKASSDMSITKTKSSMDILEDDTVGSNFIYRVKSGYIIKMLKAIKDYLGSSIDDNTVISILYDNDALPIKIECMSVLQMISPVVR